ncbi:MAG: ImmA/IrrE family metallo-endopeptidase, partial [Pseudonocardiaceae bacterium]
DAPRSIVSHRNLRDPGAPSPEIDRLIERATRNVEFLTQQDSNLQVPSIAQLARPTNLGEAEERAQQARQILGGDSAGPLVGAAIKGSNVGILAFSFDLGQDAPDAASILLEQGAVVLVNGHLHLGRRRLALVHEWGHCLFADEYTVDWRVAESLGDEVWEGRLDRFARAVLLPSEGVSRSWRRSVEGSENLRTTVVRLASEYCVDMSTLARRLLELGYIDLSQGEQVRAVRTTKADIVELNLVMHDELSAPELPLVYEESVVRLYRNEFISSARATDLLFDTWSEDDLPELPTLPENVIWKFVS